MAVSTCAKCGNHSFELKTIEPQDAKFKQNLVQCASCGVPVGVLDFFNTSALLEEQKKLILDLGRQISAVDRQMGSLDRRLNQIEKHLGKSR